MSTRHTGTGGASSSSRRTPAAAPPPSHVSGRTTPAAPVSRRPRASSTAGASSSSVAPPGPKPLFGLEIEIFVKLRPELERAIIQRRREGHQLDEEHWRNWDFTLSNGTGNQLQKEKQRECVGQAIEALIETALGPSHGWSCEADASLKEYKLTQPPEPLKWWGIEIISPPMSAGRQWRQEIHQVFAAVAEEFELWTNSFCACHVHVSPGPLKASKYTYDQLIQIGCASYFWEDALKTILPEERKNNRYAEANHTTFATAEYNGVPHYGWGPVFQSIRNAATSGKQWAARLDVSAEERAEYSLTMFACLMAGAKVTDHDPTDTATRYLSSNFLPLPRLGTVELRRQAGVASAQSAIYRALLALSLHVSALRYDFGAAASRRDRPSQAEFFKELAGSVKLLPPQCHGDRFLKWLKDCAADYAPGERGFTEKEVNQREHAFHAQDMPLPPPPPAPTGRRREVSSARPPAPTQAATPSRNPRVVPTPSRQPTMAPAQPPRQSRGVSFPIHP
ncbi:putative amidoligase enzyme-domain-containing protein [Chaetomium fimeti]|uniref:Amidoligase enzyme-domain-containing protein n=1 Tax=Chaetomium fimeti TaxID=1854472 RepID=A0AAE0HMV6_9PEZI|nr:putative amidoligase enzyme-domain-containing protein [Chaetomium fimeti]